MATYPVINNKTLSDIAAISNTQEQKWVLSTMAASRGFSPWKGLIGGYKGGKPIIEVMDTRKLKGTTINLQLLAPLGGPGVFGDNTRVGNEEKFQNNTWQFQIGIGWNGTGFSQVAKDQTVIGSSFDKQSSKMLAEWLAWKQGWDIEMEMQTAATARNTLRPNNKGTRESLGTNDYLTGATFTNSKVMLGALQGKPIKMGKTAAGSDVKRYLQMTNQYAIDTWKKTASYQGLVAQAMDKGLTNPIFSGNVPDWDGSYVYEWNLEDGTQWGPVASACLPRALLGNAITASNTAPVITGGGSTAAAAITNPLPRFFEAFSNAQYQAFESVKRQADTATTRYVVICNLIASANGGDAGQFGFYSYILNNGNALTSVNRLRASSSGAALSTIGNVTWNTGVWSGKNTDAHATGSIILETNSYGVPFTFTYTMADEAIMSGYGSIDGKTAMGRRTTEVQDHQRLYAIGLEAVWGTKAVPRTDLQPGGFVLIESAYKPPGFNYPDIVQ